jgi:hypothetical protein
MRQDSAVQPGSPALISWLIALLLLQAAFYIKSGNIQIVHFIVRRQLGHQEREFLGHINTGKGLPGKVGVAVGECEDNLDDVAGAAKLGMVISITS